MTTEMTTQAPAASTQVGFAGLGNMGRWMALNLAKNVAVQDLPPLLVYNRTASKAEAVRDEADKGTVEVAKDLKALAGACDVVFTSLSSDAAARDVYAQLLEGEEERNGPKEKRSAGVKRVIFVDTSTLYVDTVDELERLVSSARGRTFVSAPAFGPPPMSKAGSLVFAMAGDYTSKKVVARLLVPGVGRMARDLGNNVNKAASFKLLGNSMILSLIEVLAECHTLAEKTGIGAATFDQFINDFFPAPSAIGYSKKLLDMNFNSDEGFTLDGGLKDASHIRRLATSVNVPMPTVDAAHAHLVSARANAPPGKDLDWSSLFVGQRLASGLDPFNRPEVLVRQPYQTAKEGEQGDKK